MWGDQGYKAGVVHGVKTKTPGDSPSPDSIIGVGGVSPNVQRECVNPRTVRFIMYKSHYCYVSVDSNLLCVRKF